MTYSLTRLTSNHELLGSRPINNGPLIIRFYSRTQLGPWARPLMISFNTMSLVTIKYLLNKLSSAFNQKVIESSPIIASIGPHERGPESYPKQHINKGIPKQNKRLISLWSRIQRRLYQVSLIPCKVVGPLNDTPASTCLHVVPYDW